MFSRKKNAKALLFSFDKPLKMAIHSLFVFYDFFVIWLDENEKVVSIKKVKPFSFNILPSRKFTKLIEIPIKQEYDEVLNLIDEEETFK